MKPPPCRVEAVLERPQSLVNLRGQKGRRTLPETAFDYKGEILVDINEEFRKFEELDNCYLRIEFAQTVEIRKGRIRRGSSGNWTFHTLDSPGSFIALGLSQVPVDSVTELSESPQAGRTLRWNFWQPCFQGQAFEQFVGYVPVAYTLRSTYPQVELD